MKISQKAKDLLYKLIFYNQKKKKIKNNKIELVNEK